uniref:Uncharacterized protein n=1 Tax=Solanum demissum TaxID=50514 RepID=Q0KIU5_SOLDE|nr:hypothetical protein SDM1_25t00018 [Solanum demissum]
MNRLLNLYCLPMKPLIDKDGRRDKTHDILTTDITQRPNDSVRRMYEHVRGILKHTHKLELDKKKPTYLFSTHSTQLKKIR